MIFADKLKEYASKMSDAELVEAVGHLNDITFADDNIIRLMFEYAKDDDDRFVLYLPAITKALCDEAIKRLRYYSPEFV